MTESFGGKSSCVFMYWHYITLLLSICTIRSKVWLKTNTKYTYEEDTRNYSTDSDDGYCLWIIKNKRKNLKPSTGDNLFFFFFCNIYIHESGQIILAYLCFLQIMLEKSFHSFFHSIVTRYFASFLIRRLPIMYMQKIYGSQIHSTIAEFSNNMQ